MSSEVTSPFPVFYDRSGEPLDAGYIYIGTAGINPEVSPITVYWTSSLATTAAQPIRTLAGYPSRDGSPGTIFVSAATYSIIVRDKTGALVYSNLNASTQSSTAIELVADIAALRLLTATTTALEISLLCNYVLGDGGGSFRYDSTDTTSADNSGTTIVDASGKRWKRQFEAGQFEAAWFGVRADGVTDDAVAFKAAWDACSAAGGGIVGLPEGDAMINTQTVLDGNDVTVRGRGYRASSLSSTLAVGPVIILGNNTTRTEGYTFEDVKLTGIIGQRFFKSRYVRGGYLRRCGWDLDGLITLGDSAGGTSRPAYIFHMEDCPSTSQLTGSTQHFIEAENFAGQWVMNNTFVEGKFSAAVDGIYATNNIQNRIDHVIISGGYFGRFRDNYSFVDARVVNLHIGADHESEGALRNSVRLEVTSATSKTVSQVGWANCILAGKFNATNTPGIYMKNERTGTASLNWSIGPCVFTDAEYTPIIIESLAGAISAGVISGITTEMLPANANQDIVSIIGGTSAVTISDIAISNIAAEVFTTPVRSVVSVEGFTSLIPRPRNIGSVSLKSTTLRDTRLAVLDEYEYIQQPEGRLTLTSGTPVLSTEVTAATAIYYTPYKGNRIPLLEQSLFCERAFSELTLTLDSNSGNTGYQQADRLFDLFVYSDAGTLRLCTGPAWTTDTLRSAQLTLLRGILVNAASITLKYDATSATLTAPINSALYVGTMRASADGQTEMTLGAPTAAAGGTNNKLYLWNAHNRVLTTATCREATDSWTYTTATWRSKNASDSNRISFISGLAEGTLKANSTEFSANSSSNVRRYAGIAYDSTSAIAAGSLTGLAEAAASNQAQMGARFERPLALGYHFVQEIEYSAATGTTTWFGDGGGPTITQTGMTVELMM